jgi:hypothetical protein
MAVETQGLLNAVYDETTRALRTTAGSSGGGAGGGTGPAPATATILASAARTTDPTIADQTNAGYRGVHLIINVTAITATPSVVPTIKGKDPVSGSYYSLLVGTAITATGMTVLKVAPGITPVANGAAADYLPATWTVTMVHGDSDSITYSVGAVLLP